MRVRLLAVVVICAIGGAGWALSLRLLDRAASRSQWPGSAVQVLATLYLAIAIEGRLTDFAATSVRGNLIVSSVFAGSLVGLLMVTSAAGSGQAFTTFEGTYVYKSIGAMGLPVVVLPLLPLSRR